MTTAEPISPAVVDAARLLALRRQFGAVADEVNALVRAKPLLATGPYLMVVSGISSDKFEALLKAAETAGAHDAAGIVRLADSLPEPPRRGDRPSPVSGDVLADREAQLRRADEYATIAEQAGAAILAGGKLSARRKLGLAKQAGIATDKLLAILRNSSQSSSAVVAAILKVIDLLGSDLSDAELAAMQTPALIIDDVNDLPGGDNLTPQPLQE